MPCLVNFCKNWQKVGQKGALGWPGYGITSSSPPFKKCYKLLRLLLNGDLLILNLMQDWKNLRYLQQGNCRQQHAYKVLEQLALWATLHVFDPILAGTIPLAIDIPDSDLDIICEVALCSQASFEGLLQAHYGDLEGFQITHIKSRGYESIVSSFYYEGVAIEVFGQALPTAQQYAFRHLVIEAAILQLGGKAWCTAIQRRKQQGLKTEPAFASLLHLPGDPYEALLTLEGKSSFELAAQMAQCPFPLLEK